jgi:hypothetical protein
MEIEEEFGYRIELDGCEYSLNIRYFLNTIVVEGGDKHIPIIHSIMLNGVEIKPLIRLELVESIKSFLFRKKNNITI